MISNKLNKSKYQNILEYLFSLITILQCNSIFMTQVGGYFKIATNLMWQILLFVMFLYALHYFKYVNTYKLFIFMYIYISFVVIFFIIEWVYYPTFPKRYILELFVDPILLISYFVIFHKDFNSYNSILYKIENLILILAIISIPLWIMALFNVPPTSSIVTSGWYSSNSETVISSYFNLGFIVKNYASIFGLNFIRNTSIFAEPSMFSYVLNIAFFIELFLRKKTKLLNKRMLFLLIVIFTTASTTGIVFAILSIVFYEMIFKSKSNLSKWFLLLLIPVAFILLKYVILGKVSSYQYSSYAIRENDIQACISAWKNHLIIGNGLGNINPVLVHLASWRFLMGRIGVAAGLPMVLACGGIIVSLIYILPIIFSIIVSPFIFGMSIFSLVQLIFVDVQDTNLCVLIISYIWACIILKDNKYLYL